jgi:hypothetical protein
MQIMQRYSAVRLLEGLSIPDAEYPALYIPPFIQSALKPELYNTL